MPQEDSADTARDAPCVHAWSPPLSTASQRILLLAPQPFYQDRGTPIAVAHVLASLSRAGVDVDVLTFPIGRDIELPHVHITRAGPSFGIIQVPVGFSASKLLFDTSLAWRAWRMCAARRYSAIYAVEEAMLTALVLGRRFGVPLIYDMQSSIPDQLTRHWFFGTWPMQSFLRWLEGRFIRASSVVACSMGLHTDILARFPGTAIEAWRYPVAAPAAPALTAQQQRRVLGIADTAPIVYYGGNFAEYQGIGVLRTAMRQVLATIPNTVFLLVGADEQELRDFRLPAGVPEHACRVLPRISASAVPQYLALADVAVSARAGGKNLPLKIIDYMAAGKAIVATDHPAHRPVLDDDIAVLVPSTPEALAAGITELLRDPQRAAHLGAAARRRARVMFGLGAFDLQVGRILQHALPPDAGSSRELFP